MKEEILHSAIKEVELYGEFKSHKAEIDAEDLSWILQILSTNLYSDPIGSLVREYSSNAWDANIEAGNKNKPIEVGIQTNKDSGSYWYVTDLGPGLSPERIDTVYRKFGKSTKRDSNEAIGMMGLGKFSGLSYTNEVYITTRVDGIEYQYLMHKSEGTPQIDLLVSTPTDKPNGTTIRINIKDWSDKRKFINSTQEQLAFFENVYFNIDEFSNYNSGIKITIGKTFTRSTLESRNYLRIKLGPVTYPIDYDALNAKYKVFERIPLQGLALNFNIGDLAITPNRESILYNKQTIQNIEAKLNEFIVELISIYDTQVLEYEEATEYLNALGGIYVKIDNCSYNLNTLKNNNNIPFVYKEPKLKGLNVSIDVCNQYELFCGYTGIGRIQNGRKVNSEYSSFTIHNLNSAAKRHILLDKIGLDVKRTKYLCEKYNNNNYVLIKRKDKVRLFKNNSGGTCYFDILKLKKVPKAKWRETIVAFQKWQEDYLKKYCIVYDDETPTKAWLDAQKAAAKASKGASNAVELRKQTGKILVKVCESRYNSHSAGVFYSKDWPIATIADKTKIIIYGTEDDKNKLQKFYKVSTIPSYNMILIITAKANHKYFTGLTNYIHINDFMKGNSKLFKKCVSDYLLLLEIRKATSVLSSIKVIEYLNPKEAELLDKIAKSNTDFSRYGISWQSEEILESMVATATEHNLFDPLITYNTTVFKQLVDKYRFVENLTHVFSSSTYSYSTKLRTYDSKVLDFAVEIAKFKKIRIDLKHYQNDRRAEENIEETT